MKVFKFGGASVDSLERIKKLPIILHHYPSEKLLIVISAMGKTTNALEKVANAFYSGNQKLALELFEEIKNSHNKLVGSLGLSGSGMIEQQLNNFYTEVTWLLHDNPVRDFNYYYDQIVCVGELLSTAIISRYLNMEGISNQWIDVRDVFKTDDQFRTATIDWANTKSNVDKEILPIFDRERIVLTQGFIGSTDENESTTLGREGSDYSAAIFANLLNAKDLTIWKDVQGVMNADPKSFPQAVYIRELGFDEVIEMAFYGAQVIHPKTIKPLQNKEIPLHVKCFIDPTLPGTLIHSKHISGLPPIYVLKHNQTLIRLRSKDFSFVGEQGLQTLCMLLSDLHIQANLLQTGAVILQVCIDDVPEKIEKLVLDSSAFFDVLVEKGLTLLTVRHYDKNIVVQMTSGREIVLQQWSADTVQTLMH